MLALLISNQPEETAVLSLMLQQVGFNVVPAQKLAAYIENWPEEPVDLMCIVIDEDIPQHAQNIKKIRAQTVVPMIVITNPLNEDQEIALLESGVDLVFFRPFGVRLFTTKTRALLRRSTGLPFHTLPTMTRGSLVLDPGTRSVQVGEGQPERLTQLEFRLMYALMINAGQILQVETIVEQVWGYSGEGNRELVRGLVQRLRSKVEPDKHTPRYILTEKGLGYYLGNIN